MKPLADDAPPLDRELGTPALVRRHRAALSLIQRGKAPHYEDRLGLLAAVVWPTSTAWADQKAPPARSRMPA